MPEEQKEITKSVEEKKKSWIPDIPIKVLLILMGLIMFIWIVGFTQSTKWILTLIIIITLMILSKKKEEFKKITAREAKALMNKEFAYMKKIGELPPFVTWDIVLFTDREYVSDTIRYILGGANVHYPFGEIEFYSFKMFMDADGHLQRATYGEITGNEIPYYIVPELFKKIMREKPLSAIRKWLSD